MSERKHRAKARAIELLRVAAGALRQYAEDAYPIHYDEADCDGICLAEDCEIAADDLEDGAKAEGR